MNPILQVKLRFNKESNSQRPNARNLRKNFVTTVEKIDMLEESLKAVLRYYHNKQGILSNFLIDVNYNDIIAKSNRIKEILKPNGRDTDDIVVGARFSDAPEGEENHIITYYVDETTIIRTLQELRQVRDFIRIELNGKANPDNFNINKDKNPIKDSQYEKYGLNKNKIRNIIVDCSVINSFSVPRISHVPETETFLLTFYKTELPVANILEKLKIDDTKYRYSFYGDDTISVTRELFDFLNDRIPYLFSMISSDISKITLDRDRNETIQEKFEIPKPKNEPIIGVIDTLFDESVYFSDWVVNIDYLDDIEKYTIKNFSREHGTQVSSIIVDGPRLNPWLDDGCGRFRVRHFGVCEEKISTARLIRKVKEIVRENPDIHVWNVSLGTDDEISKNFISYDAAALDDIQAKNNVIFVISGTNDNRSSKKGDLRVGSPADSLNSIVVNSVKRNGTPASYSRKGNILSFFNKPDVSYYGGDYNERIFAYSPHGKEEVYGTSFAAPWISRKMCFLIDIMGMPREVAKALIIDSAAGWDYKISTYKKRVFIGYGIVPIDIKKILSSSNEEIKFVVYGTSESYKTTNYSIPVPKDSDNKYPFVARATLCYFPECSRMQGVDYTNRELSLKFGRVKNDGTIDDINDNVQDDIGAYTDERQSRKDFRKWENTKFISKKIKNEKRPLKSYNDRMWGFSVISKERLSTKMEKGLNFGVVITLKEINGINRIEDFIKACTIRGWIVQEYNVQNRINIYNSNQEEITFK